MSSRVTTPRPTGRRRGGLSLEPRGDAATVRREALLQHPILTGHDGGKGAGTYTGDQLMNEVYDLMVSRLPLLETDDPHRVTISCFLARLAPRLDRDRLTAVPSPLEARQG